MTARQLANAELCAQCVGEGCNNCDGQGYTRLPFQPDDFSPKPPLNVLAAPPDSEGPTANYLKVGRWFQCAHCGVITIGSDDQHWCGAPWQVKASDIPAEWIPGQSPLMKAFTPRAPSREDPPTYEFEKREAFEEVAAQRRIVALEKRLALRTVTRCQQCGAEALPSPTHALDLEAERNDARDELERARSRIAHLESQLSRRVEEPGATS